MRKGFAAAALIAALSMTETAGAADKGIYLGAAVGRSTSDLHGLPWLDDNDTAFKLMGGLRPLNWLGVEASYRHLGTVGHHDSYRAKQRSVDAFAVFFREIAMFDLFAKAGVVRWDLDGTQYRAAYQAGQPALPPTRVDVSDSGTDFAWGVGAQARLLSLAVRLEYERFELDSNKRLEKPRMVSLGVTWTFF